MPRIAVVLVARGRAAVYLRKAEQFCRAAAQEADAERFDAALLCAVHAGISGADAYCVAIGGRRSKEADHLRAADLLEEIGKRSPPVRDREP